MNLFTKGDRVVVTTIDDGVTRHGTVHTITGDGLRIDCDDGEVVTSPCWFVEAEPVHTSDSFVFKEKRQ